MTEPSSFWDERYAEDDYVYGTEPNSFLAETATLIPPGRVLCLAEGEGRNAVHLAGLGYAVTAVDQSAVGLAKARRLAEARGVRIETVEANLRTFAIEPGAWQGIVGIYHHMPRKFRLPLHRAVVAGLAPDGVFILEAFTPKQLHLRTGGPPDPAMMMDLAGLRDELAGLRFVQAREIEIERREGSKHTGKAAIVQVVAQKPEAA